MLRLGTLGMAGDDQGAPTVSRALVSRAIDDLACGRRGGGGFAIEQLCTAVLADTPEGAHGCIDRLIDCGIGVDAIFDVYIPRAAARLGEMWADDTLAFSAVTMGMARLTEIYRRLSPTFLKDAPVQQVRPAGGQALFALCPGETHALGVVMAADHFRRGGWSVRVELTASPAELERIVRGRPFDVVGLSAACRRAIPALTEVVARLRDAAHPATLFVLGGHLTTLEPGIAEETGADMAVGAAALALRDIDALATGFRIPVRGREGHPFQA